MKFEVVRDDITRMSADAIVLPANSKLKPGSGTSKAIFEKAGNSQLNEACKKELKKLGSIHVGSAVPTLAFNLSANYIIHAVVPSWIDGKHNEYELLSSAYLSSLELSEVLNCTSIAFPLLASGNNGFDLRTAYEIAEKSIQAYKPAHSLKQVSLVIYGRNSLALMRKLGIPVEEKIDEKYVLGQDESYKSPIQQAADEGAGIAGKFLKDGLKMADDFIKDDENRKQIINFGIQIGTEVVNKLFNSNHTGKR